MTTEEPAYIPSSPLPSKNLASTHMSAVGIHLPPFRPDDPVLWFTQVEAQFATENIVLQDTKYFYVVGSLHPEIAQEVRDLILTPPLHNRYDELIAELIRRTSPSDHRRLQQLLSVKDLGDRKPSQLLRHMRQLLGHSALENPILRQLFFQRLPEKVQIALASSPQNFLNLAPTVLAAFDWLKSTNQMFETKSIIKRYDIVLLQEIRDVSQKLLPSLVAKLNDRSSINYQFAVSEIVGRNVYKEQYAFLYRTNEKIKLLYNYTYNDGNEENKNDIFSREPFVANFEVPCSQFQKFTLVGIHISPDDAVEEIKSLEKVHDSVRRKFHSSNVIIMGDMNADCNYFSKSKWQDVSMRRSTAYLWPICDDVDTTVKKTHCAYDRFIVGGRDLRNSYLHGYAKAFRFDEAFQMKQEEAEAVSDHYPIEIVFEDTCKNPNGIVG